MQNSPCFQRPLLEQRHNDTEQAYRLQLNGDIQMISNYTLEEQSFKASWLAEYLNISESTIKTLTSRRPEALPPFFKVGNSKNSPIRWRKSDVDSWIAEQVKKSVSSQIDMNIPPELQALVA